MQAWEPKHEITVCFEGVIGLFVVVVVTVVVLKLLWVEVGLRIFMYEFCSIMFHMIWKIINLTITIIMTTPTRYFLRHSHSPFIPPQTPKPHPHRLHLYTHHLQNNNKKIPSSNKFFNIYWQKVATDFPLAPGLRSIIACPRL